MKIFIDLYNRLPKQLFYIVAIALLFMVGLEIWLTTLIPDVKGYFFNIISTRNQHAFLLGLGLYAGVYLALSIEQSIKIIISSKLTLILRTYLTKLLQKAWIHSPKFRTSKSNYPDQRINQDCSFATELSLNVVRETFISAIIVLVLIYQTLYSPLLLWSSITFSIISIGGAMLFNKPLRARDIKLQIAEAAHRQSLSKIIMQLDDFTSKEKFLMVADAYWDYAKWFFYYSLFFKGQTMVTMAIPLLLLAPQYFAHQITFGAMMQGSAQFELIVVNAAIILNIYTDMIRAQASWQRIINFYDEITIV